MQEPAIPALQPDCKPVSAATRWAWLLAAFSPALLPPYFIFKYHVNFIWADAWDMADILVRAHQHTLTFSNFWTPHNEHRMPIPYLIMFVLAKLTHWNTLFEVLFGYGMVCLNSVLVAILLKSIASRSGQSMNWVGQWFLINLLLFSPIQVENWTFGFAACQNFVPIPCIVGAILLIHCRGLNWRTLALCGLLIETASLSQANGLLGWFLIVPLIATADIPPRSAKLKPLMLGWLMMTAASFAVQFVGYQSNQLAARYYAASLTGRFWYFLLFLGSPLNFGMFEYYSISILAGFCLLAGFVALGVWGFWKTASNDAQRAATSLPWLMLGSYAIGSALLAAAGRAGIGMAQASTTRYTTISIWLIIAVIGLFPVVIKLPSNSLKFVSIGLLLVVVIWGDCRSIGEYAEAARDRRAGVAHLTFINFVFDKMGKMLVSDHPGVPANANVLNQLGYLHPPLVLSPDINRLKAPGSDSERVKAQTGSVEGGQQVEDSTVDLNGWAIIPDRARMADAVLISCETDDHEQVLCAIGDIYIHQIDTLPEVTNGHPKGFWMAKFPGSRLLVGSREIICWAYDAERQLAFPLGGLALQTQPTGK